MGESSVARKEFKTPYWDGATAQRVLAMRKDQPTTYRVTGYEIIPPTEAQVKAAFSEIEPTSGLVVELPPEQLEVTDILAHEVNIAEGHLVIRKIVGVGIGAAAWETIAIFPPGTWKKCEAINYREDINENLSE